MRQINGKSMDILENNKEKIKKIFPEVCCEDKIDFDKLKQILGEYVDDDKERYNFTWNGKGRSLRLSQTPSLGTLRPCKEESKDWDSTQNLYIEGDNLEVLKLLQKSYYGKVKMIYIDPPYNTGNDFVYPDNFSQSIESYKEITGQIDEEKGHITTNSESSGRYHTEWLNMMYPRLRLARGLLSDDGVIFISIDDNEIDNLKKICNEIFSEVNLVAEIPWQSRASIQNDTDFSVNHEYICIYAKNRRLENRRLKESNYAEWHKKDSFVCKPLPLDKSKFDNPDNDPRGLWKADPFDAPNVRPNLTYPVINPNTGEEHLPPRGRCWRFLPEKFSSAIDDNRIVWTNNGLGRPQLKVFYEEKKEFGSVDNSWFSAERVGTSTSGTKEIINLFEGHTLFDTPKPMSLILKLITLANVDKNDIILDFFSGSATTAHAVMQLNAEDGGNRRFIMVQLPEVCGEKTEAYKAGYKNICEIGKERIRRAGEKIKAQIEEENAQLKIDEEPKKVPDIGFRVFKLDSSNLKKWQPDYDDLEKTLLDSIENYVEGRSELDVVYEIILKMGLDLTYPVDELDVNGRKIYSVAFGALMICLDDHITKEIADGMISLYQKYQPELWKVVFKDNGFENDSAKTNIKEQLKAAGLEEDAFTTI